MKIEGELFKRNQQEVGEKTRLIGGMTIIQYIYTY